MSSFSSSALSVASSANTTCGVRQPWPEIARSHCSRRARRSAGESSPFEACFVAGRFAALLVTPRCYFVASASTSLANQRAHYPALEEGASALKILVCGASGAIGQRVSEAAMRAGYLVRALVRDPAKAPPGPEVEVAIGDVTDAAALEQAVEGVDAVVWAIGPTSNTPDQVTVAESGAQNLVRAMNSKGVRRLVAISGAGITVPGEHKPLGGRLMSALVRLIVRHVVAAKQREYEIFSTADLDWTLVRPPRVVPGTPTGKVHAGSSLASRTVTDGDLAQFMVDELAAGNHVRAAPFVSGALGR
jgi:putative NADH-flavin reductase